MLLIQPASMGWNSRCFTIVTLVMAVQVGFHPKSRLAISVAFRFNARSVFPGMVGIFPHHPVDLRLWLDVPVIQRPFAAAKCSRFKGIPTLNRGPSHRENHSRQQNGYRN